MMWRERALLAILLFQIHQICATNNQKEHKCPPSSCGNIRNISYPFRLKGDPKGCGDHRYEVSCENNVTLLSLFSEKYEVQAINYNNFTIRMADPGLQHPNCSFLPRYSLSEFNFTYNDATDPNPYKAYTFSGGLFFQHMVFLKCRNRVSGNSKYVDIGGCMNWEWKGYNYAIAGDVIAKDIEAGCDVKLFAPTSWWGLDANQHSYATIHTALLYGFELSWLPFACYDRCGSYSCGFDYYYQTLEGPRFFSAHDDNYYEEGIWWRLLEYVIAIPYCVAAGFFKAINVPFTFNFEHYVLPYFIARYLDAIRDYYVLPYFIETYLDYFGHYVLPYFIIVRYLVGMILFIVFLIYIWKKRNLSIYENIENYLEQNNMMPIRYTYKEIKKMTADFKQKLGQGGYGSVFKGKLRSGSYVAIKMLINSKDNGQDFINEVATIGRIHHQNIVQLIGYCVEGSKRALVYEFMPNGSLDKFIFSKEESSHLTSNIIYNIAIGVARGISYLHYGCEMQILHFDIKPHNILLDEKFTPKISDFGLAKLYPIGNSIVSMTAARGTIGYMAPELFYKNIGRISHKSDVYSFGMLLMEMASKRKNLNPHVEHSSQLYFPFWIYNQLDKEKDIKMEDVTEEDEKIVKKMIIISLWCIQLKPNDRPSINKVVEMLEGDIEKLKVPPKPSLYPEETLEESQKNELSISSSSYSTDCD